MPSADVDLDRVPLSEGRLTPELAAAGRWREVRLLDETASTSAVVAAAAESGAGEGLVVVTEHQIAGRGRLGRGWESPPRAGLTFSVLLRPAGPPPQRWSWLPLLAGLAVTDALAAAAAIETQLKWPNDVLAPGGVGQRGGKLAGILAERHAAAVTVGIGLNVTSRASELPDGATSLLLAGATSTDRAALLTAILAELERRYAAWLAGRSPVEDYRRRCATLGRQVRVELPDGSSVIGSAAAVDERGSLLLTEGSGAQRTLSSGDVVHLRAEG